MSHQQGMPSQTLRLGQHQSLLSAHIGHVTLKLLDSVKIAVQGLK